MPKYEIRKITRRVQGFVFEATDADQAEQMFHNIEQAETMNDKSETYLEVVEIEDEQ